MGGGGGEIPFPVHGEFTRFVAVKTAGPGDIGKISRIAFDHRIGLLGLEVAPNLFESHLNHNDSMKASKQPKSSDEGSPKEWPRRLSRIAKGLLF